MVKHAVFVFQAFHSLGSVALSTRGVGEEERTTREVAVCISGHARHVGVPIPANLSHWPDARRIFATMPKLKQRQFLRLLRQPNRKFTIAESIRQFLYPRLGRFDVFMFVPTKSGSQEEIREVALQNCLPFTPDKSSGAHLSCQGGSDEHASQNNTGLEPWELDLLSGWSRWPWENIFQQMQGYRLCNAMIRAHSARNDKYSLIIRLRADDLFLAPFPPLASLPRDEHVVYYPARQGHTLAGFDVFNIGVFKLMHAFLDKQLDLSKLVDAPSGRSPLWRHLAAGFSSESYAMTWLEHLGDGYARELPGLYVHPFRWARDRAPDMH